MQKFCRECECIMAGEAAFCPRCGVPWEQPLPQSLAQIADLLDPPRVCVTCRKQLMPLRFFCPRCGAGAKPSGAWPPDEWWDALEQAPPP